MRAVVVVVVAIVGTSCSSGTTRCGERDVEVEFAGFLSASDTVEVFDASAEDGAARLVLQQVVNVDRAEEMVVTFPFDDDAPVELPLGDQHVRILDAPCSGEGCDPGWINVVDEDGSPWLEGGIVKSTNEGPFGNSGDSHFSFRVGPDSCGEEGIVDVRVNNDDETAHVAAGSSVDVSIGGSDFRVIAGVARRNDSSDFSSDCVDCRGNGVFRDRSISVVLYRANLE